MTAVEEGTITGLLIQTTVLNFVKSAEELSRNPVADRYFLNLDWAPCLKDALH